jgi:hypothetical protein
VAANLVLLIERVFINARVALEVLPEAALAAVPITRGWDRGYAMASRGRLVVVRHCVWCLGMSSVSLVVAFGLNVILIGFLVCCVAVAYSSFFLREEDYKKLRMYDYLC